MPEAEKPAETVYAPVPEALDPTGQEIQTLIDWHWRWATAQLPSSRHSLAMRSDALLKNIGARIDLLKAQKGAAAGGLGLSLDEVIGALSATGPPPTDGDGAGGANPPPAGDSD